MTVAFFGIHGKACHGSTATLTQLLFPVSTF